MKKLLSIFMTLILLNFNISSCQEKVFGNVGLISAIKALIEEYTPLKNFLEKEIGRCIELFTAKDVLADEKAGSRDIRCRCR